MTPEHREELRRRIRESQRLGASARAATDQTQAHVVELFSSLMLTEGARSSEINGWIMGLADSLLTGKPAPPPLPGVGGVIAQRLAGAALSYGLCEALTLATDRVLEVAENTAAGDES